MSLEEIKKRKLQELQEKLSAQAEEHQQLQQQIEIVESVARQHLDSQAISRYGNIKAAHPDKAIQVAALIAQGVNMGQIHGKITDAQFKELLLRLQPKKQETKISIRR
ncbi:MAG: DNA-binding protein [Candidatus Woesearchaeota archaeon]